MPSKKKTKNVEKTMIEGGHNLFQNGKVAAMDVFAEIGRASCSLVCLSLCFDWMIYGD
jgi:hypothetical protein